MDDIPVSIYPEPGTRSVLYASEYNWPNLILIFIASFLITMLVLKILI